MYASNSVRTDANIGSTDFNKQENCHSLNAKEHLQKLVFKRKQLLNPSFFFLNPQKIRINSNKRTTKSIYNKYLYKVMEKNIDTNKNIFDLRPNKRIESTRNKNNSRIL